MEGPYKVESKARRFRAVGCGMVFPFALEDDADNCAYACNSAFAAGVAEGRKEGEGLREAMEKAQSMLGGVQGRYTKDREVLSKAVEVIRAALAAGEGE